MPFSLAPGPVQLMRAQWLSPERLRDIQRRKLRRLVAHAYRNVPYYRQLMDEAGAEPGDIDDPGALAKLPITHKEAWAAQPMARKLARNFAGTRLIKARTSGSSGTPVEVVYRPQDKAWWRWLALRGWLANGYRPTHRMLVLSDARFAPRGRHWYQYLGMFRQVHTSIYEDVARQAQAASTLRPHVLRGMTSDVYNLARHLREQGSGGFDPQVVITSAELMDNHTRRYINETFGVRLTDFYGSMECGWIASECSAHRGYHVNADCLIVEFVGDGRAVGPGEAGELVVTNLHAYAMPFIRYSVGDVGVPLDVPCPCGRGLPLMRTVEGRIVDCVDLPDGRRVSPYQLTCAVEQVPGVQRYQIIQSRDGSLLVKVIPTAGFDATGHTRIKRELEELLGHAVAVESVLVDELPRDGSGKFRVVRRA